MNLLPSIFSRSRQLSPIESWFNPQMDQLFQSMLQNWPAETKGQTYGIIPLDVQETDKAYTLTADMPGVDKKDVEVLFDDKILTIKVNQQKEEEKKENNYVLRERFQRAASRSITLPLAADGSKVDAKLENGLLTVAVPKSIEKQSRKIAVN